jgi:integrase
MTVNGLADNWFKWSEVNHTSKWANTLKLAVEKDFLPQYGHRLAADIRRRDAIQILKEKAATAPGQARNLHKALRGMWQNGVDEEYLEYNPFAEIRVSRTIPSMNQESRDRTLSDDEIIHNWQAIDAGGGSESTRRALKLILVTGQRPQEVAGMHEQEIAIGAGKSLCHTCRGCGWWTIPKERMKPRVEHRVYLTRFALEIIGEIKGYACPSVKPDEPIDTNAVSYHVRRKVEATKKESFYGLPRWTPHDLRRTAATKLQELGCSDEVIDAILSHTKQGVKKVYNRYKYDKQKLEWLTQWSEHLELLVKQESDRKKH